jgi:hypothetical protein
LPERIQAALYQAFDLQLLYRKDMHQVTIWATITDSTPHAVAAIINDAAHDPAPATISPDPQPSPHQYRPPPALHVSIDATPYGPRNAP